MNAQEKAKSLIEEAMYCVEDPMGNYPMCYETAKQCALISVIEILSIVFDKKPEVYDFYYDVKHEIEKL